MAIKTKSRGFSLNKEDFKKIEELKEFFNAKNPSETVRIAIDLAHTFVIKENRQGVSHENEIK